jgi:DNA polymerase III subunit beta
MKVTLNAGKLAAAAAPVVKIAPDKSPVAIINHTLLTVGDRVTLTGHDLDRSLVVDVEADAIERGPVCINAKRLTDLAKALDPIADVKVSVDGNAVVLQAGRSRDSSSTLCRRRISRRPWPVKIRSSLRTAPSRREADDKRPPPGRLPGN